MYIVPEARIADLVSQMAGLREGGRELVLVSSGAVAAGMVVVLWTAEPNYAPLSSNLSVKDSAQVADMPKPQSCV